VIRISRGHACELEAMWYHLGTTIEGFHPESGSVRLTSSPIPLIVEARDRHALQYNCTCSGSVTARTVPIDSELKYEWKASGGGEFVAVAGERGMQYASGEAVLFAPGHVPTDKQVRFVVECTVFHADEHKMEGRNAGRCSDEPRQTSRSGSSRESPQPHTPARITFEITVTGREGTLEKFLAHPKGARDEIPVRAMLWSSPAVLPVNRVEMWEREEVRNLHLSESVALETGMRYYEVQISTKPEPVTGKPPPPDMPSGWCMPEEAWDPLPGSEPIRVLSRATIGDVEYSMWKADSSSRTGTSRQSTVPDEGGVLRQLQLRRMFGDDYVVLSVNCESGLDRLTMRCLPQFVCSSPALRLHCMRDALEYEWEVDPANRDEGSFITADLMGKGASGRQTKARGSTVIWRNLRVPKPAPDISPLATEPAIRPPVTFRVTVRSGGAQARKPALTAKEDGRLQLSVPYADGLRRIQFGEIVYVDKDAPGLAPPRSSDMLPAKGPALFAAPDYLALTVDVGGDFLPDWGGVRHRFRWNEHEGWRHLVSRPGSREDVVGGPVLTQGQHAYESHHPWSFPLSVLQRNADPVPPAMIADWRHVIAISSKPSGFRQLVMFDIMTFERRGEIVALWSRLLQHLVDPGWTTFDTAFVRDVATQVLWFGSVENARDVAVGAMEAVAMLRGTPPGSGPLRWFRDEGGAIIQVPPWRGYLAYSRLRMEHDAYDARGRCTSLSIHYSGDVRLGKWGHRMLGFFLNRKQKWMQHKLSAKIESAKTFGGKSILLPSAKEGEPTAPIESYATYWNQAWPPSSEPSGLKRLPIRYSPPNAAVTFLSKGEQYDVDGV